MEKLKKGDKIGIYSPATPITYFCPKRFERAKKFLENKGFEIVEGNLTGKHDFYRSGSIKERVEELNELIRNPEIKCIMSTIGGFNSNSIIPYIDYEAIIKNPKIFIGYSDITAILFAIYAKTGINTYYGPACVASFGEFEPYNDLTFSYFEDILMKEWDEYTYEKAPFWTDEFINWEDQEKSKEKRENKWEVLREGRAKGRIIAGNLNTMLTIWDSPYMPKIKKGDILLIEDSLKDIGTVERSFAYLKINGTFDKIGGLILGKHELFDDKGSGRKHYEPLLEILEGYNFPILSEVDCSHTHPMFTMPIGVEVELVAIKGEEKIKIYNKI